MTIIYTVIFLILAFLGFKYAFGKCFVVSVPGQKGRKMALDGSEMLIYFLFCTGVFALTPFLSIRLAILEILCIIGMIRAARKPIFSVPIIIYFVFLTWAIIGIFYSSSTDYGVRMLLKYLAPMLMGLFASACISDSEMMLKCAIGFRRWFIIAALVSFVPGVDPYFHGIFWHKAGIVTTSITVSMFSLAMIFASNDKKRNIWWFILSALLPFYAVFRTDILGLFIAFAVFIFVRYRFKSLPLIAGVGVLAVCSIFYIPAIKNKMYLNPEQVTMTDFLSGSVDEDNVRTNGRKQMWEDVENNFVKDHEWIGCGTGRVQTFFYEDLPPTDWRHKGQVHSDFLVLRADNGYIGLYLYVFSYIAILVHCMAIYKKSRRISLKLCALVAGSSLLGIMATMYSDNTISYSMVTLSYPWAFYGMALSMWRKEKLELQQSGSAPQIG